VRPTEEDQRSAARRLRAPYRAGPDQVLLTLDRLVNPLHRNRAIAECGDAEMKEVRGGAKFQKLDKR
jgi:hypothetical protein